MAMEELKQMKTLLTSQVQAQLANIEKADAHELGAAMDMIKDLAMTMYYCSVVDAMEEAEKEAEKNGNTVYYTERYLPYYMDGGMRRYNDGRMYADGRRDGDNDGRYGESRYYDNNRNRMYTNGGGQGEHSSGVSNSYYRPYDYDEPVMRDMTAGRTQIRDMREGRSPQTRRMYMEAKEQHQGKEVQLKELEKYMGELSQDVTEMIADATPEEKQMLHKKLAALTNKIELLNK